jgi:hypothetical protein
MVLIIIKFLINSPKISFDKRYKRNTAIINGIPNKINKKGMKFKSSLIVLK